MEYQNTYGWFAFSYSDQTCWHDRGRKINWKIKTYTWMTCQSDKQAKESSCMCVHVHACINSMDPIQDGAPKIWKKQSQRNFAHKIEEKDKICHVLVPFGVLHNQKKTENKSQSPPCQTIFCKTESLKMSVMRSHVTKYMFHTRIHCSLSCLAHLC